MKAEPKPPEPALLPVPPEQPPRVAATFGGTAAAASPALPRRAAHASRRDEAHEAGTSDLMSTPARTADRPADAVAGILAALAIVASLVALDYRPIRITPFAILLALIAAGLSGRNQRLSAIALGVSGACFVLGTFFAIITNHPDFQRALQEERALLQQTRVSMPDVDAVNSGYARVLLEQYLENPKRSLPSGGALRERRRRPRSSRCRALRAPAGDPARRERPCSASSRCCPCTRRTK